MSAIPAAAKTAARKLSNDLSDLKTTRAVEQKMLTTIKAELKKDIDAFMATPPKNVAQETALLKDVFALGEKRQLVRSTFDAHVAADVKRGRALLPDARPALSTHTYNQDRVELGLKAVATPPPPTSSKKNGKAALDLARSMLGTNIKTLKTQGPLVGILDKHVGNTICCANFVSACLVKTGLIKPSQHTDRTRTLAHELSKDKDWTAVGAHNLKPGDVVCFDVPNEGHYAHTEIFAGYDKKGNPTYIGSNNVNKDGSQRISYGHGYAIDAAFHYTGG